MSYSKKIVSTPSDSSESVVSISEVDYDNLSSKDANVFYLVDTAAPSSTPVTGVTISKSSTTIEIDGTETLSATVAPSNATNKTLVWSSSNESVATVSTEGLVTGKSAGIAIITVTTVDGMFSDNCSTTVPSVLVPTSGVALNKSSAAIYVGSSETLVATISPANATNQSITWSSSNESVSTVSSGGLVTGVSAGSATITVTTADGGFTATCVATISVATVSVTGVTLNKSSTTITGTGTETLVATVAPSNATNKTVSWSSSNESVATVSSGGLVTGVSAGSATITVTTVDGGLTATCAATIASAYPGLWQGTKTASGVTVTISGNHVTINGTKQSTGGGGYLTDNLATLFVVPATWYTFTNGTQLSITVSNNSGSFSANSVNGLCVIRKTDNTILTGATWDNPSGTFTHTCSGSTPVYGLLFYAQANDSFSNYQFDVQFSVNGTRWI